MHVTQDCKQGFLFAMTVAEFCLTTLHLLSCQAVVF